MNAALRELIDRFKPLANQPEGARLMRETACSLRQALAEIEALGRVTEMRSLDEMIKDDGVTQGLSYWETRKAALIAGTELYQIDIEAIHGKRD